ncbi:hypothetical protein HA466_0109310 [Hirschfeldia incana]|nr:hypothetical protein HA466_0109310 [Hirschfeldia incana]
MHTATRRLEKCWHAFSPTMRFPRCQQGRMREGQTKHLLRSFALFSKLHKLGYSICTFHNPSHVQNSFTRRKRLRLVLTAMQNQ